MISMSGEATMSDTCETYSQYVEQVREVVNEASREISRRGKIKTPRGESLFCGRTVAYAFFFFAAFFLGAAFFAFFFAAMVLVKVRAYKICMLRP
jgi:hypothetical protein